MGDLLLALGAGLPAVTVTEEQPAHLPVGPVPVATGFSGHGFEFAPVLGELLADLAQGGRAVPRFAFRA